MEKPAEPDLMPGGTVVSLSDQLRRALQSGRVQWSRSVASRFRAAF